MRRTYRPLVLRFQTSSSASFLKIRINMGSAGEVFLPLIRATVAWGIGASCFKDPGAACTVCPVRVAAAKAKAGRCARLSMEIMGGFRLEGTKGTYCVSNRQDQPFAGNCGNKWLALGLRNPLKRPREHRKLRDRHWRKA